MAALSLFVAIVLLVSVAAGLYRIGRGPSAADFMLSVQLFGTTGVAVVLLLGRGLALPALTDVALVFTALAAVTAAAFAANPPGATAAEEDDGRA